MAVTTPRTKSTKAPKAKQPAPERDRQSNMRRGLVEAEILEQSAKLFAQRGFAATSVQDIAETIGISRPALYHYFRSKEEILERLTQGLIESTTAALAALTPDGAPDDRLVELVHALTGPIAEAPNRFRLVLTRDASMSDAAGDRLHRLEREVIRSVTSVIEDGMSSGRFRRGDVRVATFAVIGMINWVAWWYVPDRGPAIEDLKASIGQQALASLRSADDEPAPMSVPEVIAGIKHDLDHLEQLARGS